MTAVAYAQCHNDKPVHLCYIFDDWYSYAHALLGVVVAVSREHNMLLALLLLLLFMVYEVVEDRVHAGLGRAKCDIIEFLAGYLIGDIFS